MPKWVDDLVKKLLADPDFYPDESPEERKRLAHATANKQYNKMKKKKKKSEGDMPDYHGEMLFQIKEGGFSLVKDLEADGLFYGVRPNDPNSLMVRAIAQTEAVKDSWWFGKYQVLEECYAEGLPALEKYPNNIVYVDHRYDVDNNIGITRKIIPPNEVIFEIYRGENREKGNTVAQGIIDKRVRAVSTGFNVTEQLCGICGEVGKPRIMCKHFPGETYNGVENIIKVRRAQYFEISPTSRGADDGAIIMHHNSFSRLFQDDFGETLIKEGDEELIQIPNIGDPTKLSNEEKELIKKNAQLEEQINSYDKKFKDLEAKMNNLTSTIEQKNTEITSLKSANTDLSEQVKKVEQERKEQLMSQAFELRKACGWVTESAKQQDYAYLETQNENQLNYLIKQAQDYIKANKIESKKSEKTPSIPVASGFDSNQFKDSPNQSQMSAMEKALNQMKEIVRPWKEKKRSGGGIEFASLPWDRRPPSGHYEPKDKEEEA